MTLKGARVDAGFRQAQVAKALDVTVATVSSWEQGKTYPNLLQAKALADMYHCTLDDFIFK